VSTVPVFDFHARLSSRPGALAALLAALDFSGIAGAAVSAGGVVDLDRLSTQLVEGGHVKTTADNDAVLAACTGSGGRLVPFYFANPYAGSLRYRCQAPHFRGLELSPAVYGIGFADPRTEALVEVAAAAGHPVYTVCVGQPGARAADLVALARRFPSVPFVFGHCGFTGLDTNGLNQIAGQENILAETSGCFSVVARTALERLGPDRVLFGTEYPLQDPRVELAKFAALGLDPCAWRKVAWHNALRLLGEEPS
jgi:predicted TIM-barrel fold metal-dependent hydrolase